MKSFFKYIFLVTTLLLSITNIQAQIKNATTITAKVFGNCEMCKSKIEKAGTAKLQSKVLWNSETQIATITYDANKTSVDAILKKIADVGYDNEKYQATEEVYNNLHGCCQYDRIPKEQLIKVEQKEEVKANEVKLETSIQSSAFLQIGDAMPSITLSNLLSKKNNISDFKNKWVLIDFWASWCKPCRVANKELVKLYQQTDRNKLEVISISIDTDKTQWKKAITQDQLKNIQLIDPNGFEATAVTRFGVEQIPSSFLFNSKGILVEMNPSEANIKQLINKK